MRYAEGGIIKPVPGMEPPASIEGFTWEDNSLHFGRLPWGMVGEVMEWAKPASGLLILTMIIIEIGAGPITWSEGLGIGLVMIMTAWLLVPAVELAYTPKVIEKATPADQPWRCASEDRVYGYRCAAEVGHQSVHVNPRGDYQW